MFCVFCGKEIRNGAVFCSQCGKNQSTGLIKNKKKMIFDRVSNKCKLWILGAVCGILLLLGIIINTSNTRSIAGVWMCGIDQVKFTQDGSFQWDATYGTYTIEEDKTLIMQAGEYSYKSGKWEYEYGKEAKEDSDYWYIAGDTLYWRGKEYKKQ